MPPFKSKCVNVNVLFYAMASFDQAIAEAAKPSWENEQLMAAANHPIRSSINIDSYLTSSHNSISILFFSSFFSFLFYSHIRAALFAKERLDVQFKDISALVIVTSLRHNWLRKALIELVEGNWKRTFMMKTHTSCGNFVYPKDYIRMAKVKWKSSNIYKTDANVWFIRSCVVGLSFDLISRAMEICVFSISICIWTYVIWFEMNLNWIGRHK